MGSARRALAARAVVVWLIGVLLVFTGVPVNVILPAYGVLFLLGTCLIGLSLRHVVAVAAVCSVAMPVLVAAINTALGGQEQTDQGLVSTLLGWYYPFPVWVAFLAVGIAAGRFLRSSPSLVRPSAILVVLGGLMAVVGHRLLGVIADRARAADGPWLLTTLRDDAHSSGIGEVIGSGGLALAVTGICVLVCLTPLRHLAWPLRAMGSMPLTAYTAHLVVWLLWAGSQHLLPGAEPDRLLSEFRDIEPFWPVTLGIVVGCSLWSITVGKGPLENLVGRAATALASTRYSGTASSA